MERMGEWSENNKKGMRHESYGIGRDSCCGRNDEHET